MLIHVAQVAWLGARDSLVLRTAHPLYSPLLFITLACAMAKAQYSQIAEYCLDCEECGKSFKKKFNPDNWGEDEDYELRNRLSCHHHSCSDHGPLGGAELQKVKIVLWKGYEQFAYNDPRAPTAKKAKADLNSKPKDVKGSSAAGPELNQGKGQDGGRAASSSSGLARTWCENVLERLDNIESSVENIGAACDHVVQFLHQRQSRSPVRFRSPNSRRSP